MTPMQFTIFFVAQMRQKHLRRRMAEKALRKLGMSRRRALKISRHIP